jgi:DNA-binding response OmpR family regulator
VVDDEPQITRVLKTVLSSQGYQVRTAAEGESALSNFKEWSPELVITDLYMPHMDGVELCRRIREVSTVPIIVLSVKGEEKSKVEALDSGADDYVTKPFGVRELRARIAALLRRTHAADAPPVIRIGDAEVDFSRGEIRRGGSATPLTPLEFRLLQAFVRARGRILTRAQLITEAWGPNTFVSDRVVDNHIGSLRKKIELDASEPRYLLNIRGLGYRFDG